MIIFLGALAAIAWIADIVYKRKAASAKSCKFGDRCDYEQKADKSEFIAVMLSLALVIAVFVQTAD